MLYIETSEADLLFLSILHKTPELQQDYRNIQHQNYVELTFVTKILSFFL